MKKGRQKIFLNLKCSTLIFAPIIFLLRFASEYGFQSFASFEILSPMSEPADWNVNSDFMNHRQRHPNGNAELKMQIRDKMDLPDETQLETEQGFKEFLYLAQVSSTRM